MADKEDKKDKSGIGSDYVVEDSQGKSNKIDSTVTKIKAVNPIFALFGLIVIITVLIIIFTTLANQKDAADFESIQLTEDELSTIDSNEAEIETTAQRLTIGPATEFSNSVLIKDSLEVVGDLSVSGSITIPNLDITNGAKLQGAEIAGNLAVSGNGTIQGSLDVNGGATIDGNLTVGSLTTGDLSISSDLRLSRHIVSQAGSTSVSKGSALSGSATVSASGNDIAGSVTVNTGSGSNQGILANISFRIPYGSTPAVVITPVDSGHSAGTLYYVQRSSSGFSIGIKGTPPSGANLRFDYIVIE